MQVLHLVGHRHNWNIESFFQNNVGDGFIFCAYNFPYGFFERDKINSHKTIDILDKSFIDLQFFAKKDAANKEKGKLDTYSFHPANSDLNAKTNVAMLQCIKSGIKFQIEELGLKNVIIPNYYENDDINKYIGFTKEINNWLKKNKKSNVKYFMTLPLSNHTIIDKNKIDDLLYHLTDMNIQFDGYYIVCESKPETGRKLSIDFKYLNNLTSVFEVFKKQGFVTIYAYANWDALVFASVTDIDYITIGSYENLRNFTIRRFVEDDGIRMSKGWYFSEKILNLIKSPYLENIRLNKGLDLIKNEKNIFSDAILEEGYLWNNHKAEVHKNYLVSVERLIKKISAIENINQRKLFTLNLIKSASDCYNKLIEKNIYLVEESKNYHLGIWEAFIKSTIKK